MTDIEYSNFVQHYRDIRLGRALDFEFVMKWRRKIEEHRPAFSVEDLKLAAEDIAADSQAKFPMNDLPLLLEYAEENQRRRMPREFPELPPRMESDSVWDKWMLDKGVISKREFQKRQKEHHDRQSASTAQSRR